MLTLRLLTTFRAVYRRKQDGSLAAVGGCPDSWAIIAIARKHKQDTGLSSPPNLPPTSSSKPPMNPWYGPPYSPMSAPSVLSHVLFCRIDLTFTSQEDSHLWEDSNVYLPVSNSTQLIGDGHEFTEAPWYLQYDFPHVGSTSPGPAPSVYVSTQHDVAAEHNPFEGPIIAQERQDVATNLLLHQPPPQPLQALPCQHLCRSPTPPTCQAEPSLPPNPSNTSTRASTPSLPNEEARRILDTWIMNSHWLREDKMEPVVGGPGVPTCALQLASSGQSIYCCFLIPVMARKGKILGWKSATDPTSTPDRHQRAIGKERAKRGHCPFKCPRDHDPDWFVRSMVAIDQVLTLNL